MDKTEIRKNIEEELAQLPKNPGVYIMHDDEDRIIYIGKAVNLRNRVRQYFRGGDGRAILSSLVPKVAHVEYIVTDSEVEALVLENNLIKEHRPKYNTLLKDDKTYPYIRVTMFEAFPRVLLTRQVKRDGCRYFGPFPDAGAVRSVIDIISKHCGLRTCSRKIPGNNSEVMSTIGSPTSQRACLNYHMGVCSAPCIGNVTKEEYAERVKKALDFLGGHYAPLIEEIRGKMQDAASRLEFEKAAEYKEQLEDIDSLQSRQKITDTSQGDRDIVAVATDGGTDAVVQIFFVRNGKLTGRDHLYMEVPEGGEPADILSGFVRQYYSGSFDLPSEIFLQTDVPDAEVLGQWLSERKGRKVSILVPQRGDKEKLVELAEKNARLILDKDREKLRRRKERTEGACRSLGELAGAGEVHRIEAYDISNISGYDMVGSMVVFEDGEERRHDYRRFRIKTVEGQNDYAAMREVLTRRFLHGLEEKKENKGSSFTRFPDLILMDGGRGQVNIALDVLSELGLSIPVCGMVKDDHHRTRGLYSNNVEVPIRTDSSVFHLITRVQDEAHRFAITYHRSLRGKGQVKSVLDDIEGVGPARRKALMKAFETIDLLRDATADEIAEKAGLPAGVAENIRRALNSREG
ncbi:MAG: excinuclease ABC subunit UvrC [Eubacterium sp.]|nr:excinuclease ABC subunit UvrC [Eubacterium sp.]